MSKIAHFRKCLLNWVQFENVSSLLTGMYVWIWPVQNCLLINVFHIFYGKWNKIQKYTDFQYKMQKIHLQLVNMCKVFILTWVPGSIHILRKTLIFYYPEFGRMDPRQRRSGDCGSHLAHQRKIGIWICCLFLYLQ